MSGQQNQSPQTQTQTQTQLRIQAQTPTIPSAPTLLQVIGETGAVCGSDGCCSD